MSKDVVSDKKKTFLGWDLTPHQDAVVNCLIPTLFGCILYILIIASDIAVVYRHYKDEDPIWASLTLWLMCFPALLSYMIILSNWDLWPYYDNCGKVNIIWATIKTLQHLLFPGWRMWRLAERLFWSIEAVRSINDKDIVECMSHVHAPRSIELYIFLQGYTHALPQILLQIYILMRHKADINGETVDAQVLSIIFNLAKVAITTTNFQRFKSQKLAGREYPWYKKDKVSEDTIKPIVEEVVLRKKPAQTHTVIENTKKISNLIENDYDIEVPKELQMRRRSSDIYLEPTTSLLDRPQLNSVLETDFDEIVQTRVRSIIEPSIDEVDGEELPPYQSRNMIAVPTQHKSLPSVRLDETDFNFQRIINIRGMKEDDLAGKTIAFIWWFCFLLARILALSAFNYFFPKDSVYLVLSHFLLVIAFLLYDVKSDAVNRSKAVFFVFIGLIYIFCIIEFKIKFKKVKFIYYGFFILVFVENLVMCLIWFTEKLNDLENDYWFRYIFYIVLIGTITSIASMSFYFIINKPDKIVVQQVTIPKDSSRHTFSYVDI